MFNFFGSTKTGNEELKQQIAAGAFLVDVRTPEEFRYGSAKGAVNIPLDSLQNNLKKFEGKNHIVVFCRSGNRSAQAKRILESNGFKNVTNGGTWEDVADLV
ncbi:MAG: rhodanese-like domain-containing protein [Chitinophagales bacterium]|nr:rhodanese-like domain-containing protein [Chitinophagales bacterium]